MSKAKIFVSFDYENDRDCKHLLNAFSANPYFDFIFDDKSSEEILHTHIPVVRTALTKKIKEADYALVIVGKEANKLHKDHASIGYRNWQNFEIARSKDAGKQLIAIKIEKSYYPPVELLSSGAKWALSFSVESILAALRS